MCGEIDDAEQVGLDVAERLMVLARMLKVEPGGETEGAPAGLDASAGRAAYMEALFAAGLRRALGDTAAADPAEAVDAIACQAIAFARLAGFLAGQLPPEACLFRPVMDAVLSGHAETARLTQDYRLRQDELHGHSHDDDGNHHHHHHHGPHGHLHG